MFLSSDLFPKLLVATTVALYDWFSTFLFALLTNILTKPFRKWNVIFQYINFSLFIKI